MAKKQREKNKNKDLEKTRLTGFSSNLHYEEMSVEDIEAEETQHLLDIEREKEEQRLRREINRLYIDGNVVPRTRSGAIKKEKQKPKPNNHSAKSK